MKYYAVTAVFFLALLFGTPAAYERLTPLVYGLNATPAIAPIKTIRLLTEESGEIIEITAEDYLTGCLYAQIPVNYHEEALKAQAVAAYTYALKIMANARNNRDGKTDNPKNYDLTDSATTCQPYFTPEKAKEYYGGEYADYYNKVRIAAEYGARRVIVYGEEPIFAVYHSVSSGKTNTARAVWGRDFPYLQTVNSEWDRDYINNICVNEYTAESMREAVINYNPDMEMPVDYSLWFGNFNRNEAGYVETLQAGKTALSGGDMWRIFNLRSPAFEISCSGDVFSVVTKGFGHGAGLSQYGADYMARRGYSCEEILKYYYTEVEIINR